MNAGFGFIPLLRFPLAAGRLDHDLNGAPFAVKHVDQWRFGSIVAETEEELRNPLAGGDSFAKPVDPLCSVAVGGTKFEGFQVRNLTDAIARMLIRFDPLLNDPFPRQMQTAIQAEKRSR